MNRPGVVLIGAGGHGREVAEIVRHQASAWGTPDVIGFLDDNPLIQGKYVDGIPVLGMASWLESAPRERTLVLCALGNPSVCRRLAAKARELGFSFHRAISPLAAISPQAIIGEGATVFPGAVMNTSSALGEHSILNVSVSVSHDSRVGPYCNVNPGVRLAGNVTVGEGCYLGMGTNVIQNIRIGRWAVTGAGSVVIHDLPAGVTAVGVPARVIKTSGALHD